MSDEELDAMHDCLDRAAEKRTKADAPGLRASTPPKETLRAVLEHIERYEGQETFTITKWQLDILDRLAALSVQSDSTGERAYDAGYRDACEDVDLAHAAGERNDG